MDVSGFKFKAIEEYPSLDGLHKSSADVRLLQDAFAGKASEFSAIAQYMYQHLISNGYDASVAEVFSGISLVEMHHYELLGEAIAKMGGDPIVGGVGGWWRGDYVYYSRSLREMLDRDIRDEEMAIRDYRRIAQLASQNTIKELVERIIADEELHILILSEVRRNLTFWK